MKIGDKIICKDHYRSENLSCGDQYVVADINQYGNIQVENQFGDTLPHFYKTNRFELVEPFEKSAGISFDSSKRYKTRDGRDFHFIGISQNKRHPIVGEVLEDSGDWVPAAWVYNGCFHADAIFGESDLDLIEVPDKIELSIGGVPVVVYDDLSILFDGNSATEPLTEKEIDLFVEALQAFKK